MADGPDTLSVVSDIDGKRCKLVIKSGLRTLTVANIKKHLVGPTGVPVCDQVLSFNGEVLDDKQTGEQLGLRKGSLLRLSAAGVGLPPPPAPMAVQIQQVPVQPVQAQHEQAPPYYSPSESSMAAPTHQVSTVSKESTAEPMGRPLPAPYATITPQPAGLQPDMRGRERQKENELYDLQRRADEMHADRSTLNQAGLRNQPAQAYHQQPAHQAQQTPGYSRPNPARIDPMLAGPNDYQAAQERKHIENQVALSQQIEMEKSRLSQMQSNTTERQGRHERMINGSRRERELEERIAVLEQHCERMQVASETSKNNEVVMEQNLTNLEKQLNNKHQEIEVLRVKLAHAEERNAEIQIATNQNVCGLELARRNLIEFGKELGVEADLDFDENLTCVVGVEQKYTVLLTYDQATERLYMYSTLLTYLPKDIQAKLKLYEILLEGALMGREMAGGGVGLSMKNELLLMSTSVDLKHSDAFALKATAPHFVDCLAKWRQTVRDFLSRDPPVPSGQSPYPISHAPSQGRISPSPMAPSPANYAAMYTQPLHTQSQPPQPQPQLTTIDTQASLLAQQIDEQERQIARQQLLIERQRKLATTS